MGLNGLTWEGKRPGSGPHLESPGQGAPACQGFLSSLGFGEEASWRWVLAGAFEAALY